MLRTRIATSTLAIAAGALTVAAVRPALLPQEPVQPTEHHARLLAEVGDWEGTLIWYMAGTPSEPIAASQTVEGVGALWTQTRFECEFMGLPYVGTGCMGYDTAKKKYVGTWVDSATTYIALMEGEWDAGKHALVMRWEAPDPVTGETLAHRSETVHAGDGYTSTFYVGEGEGTRSMIIEMKRKAKKATEGGADK